MNGHEFVETELRKLGMFPDKETTSDIKECLRILREREAELRGKGLKSLVGDYLKP